MIDHDQRLKTLLQEFPAEFFAAFLPEWVSYFDFSRVEWLPTEAFLDPPRGERRVLDLVARLPVREEHSAASADEGRVAEPGRDVPQAWLALIHIEIDGTASIAAFRPRMYEYYSYLRRKHGTPVLPVALFLNLGLEGVGTDVHSERIGAVDVLTFQYLYVGLKALDASSHVSAGNPVSSALSGLMRSRQVQSPLLKAMAADTIRSFADRNEWRMYLLLDCLDAYFPLTPEETVQYNELMATERFR